MKDRDANTRSPDVDASATAGASDVGGVVDTVVREITTAVLAGSRAVGWVVGLSGAVTLVSVWTLLIGRGADAPALVLLGPVPSLYFVLVAFGTLSLRPRVVAWTGLLATLQMIAVALVLTRGVGSGGEGAGLSDPDFHLRNAAMLGLMSCLATTVAWALRNRMSRIASEVLQQDRILELFGQHTAPEVVAALVDTGGDMRPERRQVGILFLDIRGFTAESERMSPEEVVQRLDGFFDVVLPCVTANGGIVHQLLGDGFMAIFGAPQAHEDDARRSLRTAIQIHETLERACDEGRLVDTHVVMGVHFGDVVAGPVGTSDHKEYKVTGDAVNVASRLETMAKDRDARILTSRAAVTAAGMENEVLEDLGEVEIRGRMRPLRVLRLR